MWTSIFFFKQKTAYEMRISDWSSDVCSSDLEIFYRVFGAWLLARLDATGAQYLDESPQAALRSFFAALLVAPAVTVTVLFAHGEVPPEIGRASCRERVCPDV